MATPISIEDCLTQEMLLKSHYYNPETGLFYKRLSLNKLKLTGTSSNGYLVCRINATLYLVHRLAWLYMTGEWPKSEVDHIDGVKDNNAWNNLRAANRSNNMENQKRARVDNSTGLLGAICHGSKFKAKIQVKGQFHYLGTFDTSEEAHQAYIKAKRELHSFNTL